MFYGAVAWDPWVIVAQIVCLQCLYYLSLGLFLSILVGPRVPRMSLVYFFDFATVTAATATGWCVIASIFLSSIAGAGLLVYLVERAKKCLDFSATTYIIHLLICFLYGGWPASITWWVVNITGLAVMSLLGEYLCMRRELREIPIGRFRSIVYLLPASCFNFYVPQEFFALLYFQMFGILELDKMDFETNVASMDLEASMSSEKIVGDVGFLEERSGIQNQANYHGV